VCERPLDLAGKLKKKRKKKPRIDVPSIGFLAMRLLHRLVFFFSICLATWQAGLWP
jgi:hypothetical protein